MQGFKYFVRDGVMRALIKCDEVISIVDVAKALKSLINVINPKKVILYKLGVNDNIDMVYASLLQNSPIDGVLTQEWENVRDLIKLLKGILESNLPTDYLCA